MAGHFRYLLIIAVASAVLGISLPVLSEAPQTHVREYSTDEFLPMSDVQAADLAIKKLEEVNRAVGVGASLSQEECAGPQVTVLRDGKNQQVAICMLVPSDKVASDATPETSREPSVDLWGRTVSPTAQLRTKSGGSAKPPVVAWEFSTGNDANLTNLGTKVRGDGTPEQKLNDDVGRTFDVEVKRRETTDEGYSEVRVGSLNFGQRGKVNGSSRDAEGRPYMKLLNITSLELEKGTVISSQNGVTDLRVVEGSIEVSTGKAKSLLGTELQTWFHETTKSGPIYKYLDHDKMRATATVKAGMTRVIEGDLGAFRCKVTATGLVGIGTDGKPVLDGRLNTSISTGTLGGRSKDNPWLQLDAYRTHLVKSGDRPTENYGAKLSTSVEVMGTRVKPFIGVSKYDGPLDRQYAAGSRGGHKEKYWQFGIAIEKNF
jgi:hypothetical protein